MCVCVRVSRIGGDTAISSAKDPHIPAASVPLLPLQWYGLRWDSRMNFPVKRPRRNARFSSVEMKAISLEAVGLSPRSGEEVKNSSICLCAPGLTEVS